MARPYGIFAASITSTSGPSSASNSGGANRSATTTSARASKRRPRTVIRSGSPGPPPTRATPAAAGSAVSARHARLKTFDDGGADCCRTTVIAARQNSDAHTVVLGAGGSDGGAVLRVVGAHAEDVATLRFGDDRRIGFRLVGRGDGVPRTFEVAVGVRTLFDRDLTGSGHTFDGWSERATDDVNAGTRGDQQSESALSHSAATEHDHASIGQVEADQVVGPRLRWTRSLALRFRCQNWSSWRELYGPRPRSLHPWQSWPAQVGRPRTRGSQPLPRRLPFRRRSRREAMVTELELAQVRPGRNSQSGRSVRGPLSEEPKTQLLPPQWRVPRSSLAPAGTAFTAATMFFAVTLVVNPHAYTEVIPRAASTNFAIDSGCPNRMSVQIRRVDATANKPFADTAAVPGPPPPRTSANRPRPPRRETFGGTRDR